MIVCRAHAFGGVLIVNFTGAPCLREINLGRAGLSVPVVAA